MGKSTTVNVSSEVHDYIMTTNLYKEYMGYGQRMNQLAGLGYCVWSLDRQYPKHGNWFGGYARLVLMTERDPGAHLTKKVVILDNIRKILELVRQSDDPAYGGRNTTWLFSEFALLGLWHMQLANAIVNDGEYEPIVKSVAMRTINRINLAYDASWDLTDPDKSAAEREEYLDQHVAMQYAKKKNSIRKKKLDMMINEMKEGAIARQSPAPTNQTNHTKRLIT